MCLLYYTRTVHLLVKTIRLFIGIIFYLLFLVLDHGDYALKIYPAIKLSSVTDLMYILVRGTSLKRIIDWSWRTMLHHVV